MSEEQVRYIAELEDLAREEECPFNGAVTVAIDGPQGSGKSVLGHLLSAILVDSNLVDLEIDGRVHVVGYVDESVREFVERLAAAEKRVTELKAAVESAHMTIRALSEERHKAVLAHELEGRVSRVLEGRLGELAARKLALAVAHGDVAPAAYEGRRKMEVAAVREFVATTRNELGRLGLQGGDPT
jgi:hypothetical protein